MAKLMPLYLRETEFSPLYNVEVKASIKKRLKSCRCTTAKLMPPCIKETEISPLYNGEVNASVFKRD